MEMKDTQFMTAEEKHKVLNQFRKFVEGGFQESNFSKDLYNHLHLHCGFIAHYNKSGFYEARFLNHKGLMQTISQLSTADNHGGPDYKDINKELAKIISGAGVKKQFKEADIKEANRILMVAKKMIHEAVMLKESNGEKVDKAALNEAILAIDKEILKAS